MLNKTLTKKYLQQRSQAVHRMDKKRPYGP
jgi:hypothetical protein